MFHSFLRSAVLILSLAFAASAPAQTTVTLQQGLNAYTGTIDAGLWSGGPDTNRDLNTSLRGESTDSVVIRFAIFESEGGPVPNGATITSATLSLYQFSGPDAVIKASRLLKSWVETQVTWNVAATGAPWTTPGANSAGNDYVATADGQGSSPNADANNCTTPADVCWLHINVTSGVQAFAADPLRNFGWKLAQVSSSIPGDYKNFNSSENANFPSLRPKLTITYTVSPVSTVTLMQGLNSYTGTTDAHLWGASPDTNRDTVMQLRGESTDSAVIRFAVFESEGGPVPNNANITSATLSLYKFGGPDAVIKASRLLKSFNETQVTWNVAAIGTPWTTPGANSSGNDYVATADGQGSVGDATANGCGSAPYPAACWLNIDVTSGAQAFAANPASNLGWKLAQVSSSIPGDYKNFNASENTNFPDLRPKLTVSYTSGCTPPTAQLAATPSSGPAPLNVTFNASGSTDGSSAITELRLQFDDGTPDALWSDKNQAQQHTYTTNDVYTATLTAANLCGTSAPVTRTITVGGPTPPAASLAATPQSGVAPLNVIFDASGTTQGSGAITNLRLSFGDGAPDVNWTDKSQTQPHTYTGPGLYTATLTVTDANGLSDSASKTIRVDPVDGTEFGSLLPLAPSGETRPTFHSMSLYYDLASAPTGNRVFVRYRKATEDPNGAGFAWKQGWPLWYDTRDSTQDSSLPYKNSNGVTQRVRGSIVYLTPGTKYVFELGTGNDYASATWQYHLVGTTWAETAERSWPETLVQDGATIVIPAGSTVYNITSGGSAASGYKVYDGQNNQRALPGTSAQMHCIRVSVSYVVVRRVKCTGGWRHGIFIAPGMTNVVVEDNDISDWDYDIDRNIVGWGNVGRAEMGGIHLGEYLNGNNSRIVIQRNKIYDPKWGANPWDFGHPGGPTAIMVWEGGRQNVIRYNEAYATGNTTDKKKWLMDGIMGENNFGTKGFPGSDSDVYHNHIRNVMDDGIEAEGGGLNVRVWGNYVDQTFVGIGTTAAHFGPIYVFRNILNRGRRNHGTGDEPDDDGWGRGAAFKAYGKGGGSPYGGGRQYIFNNTVLQQPGSTYNPPQNDGLGTGGSLQGGSNNQGMRQTWSRNNILHLFRTWGSSIVINDGGANNDLDYDLHTEGISTAGSTGGPYEVHGIGPDIYPTYKTGHGWGGFPRLTAEPNGPPEAVWGPGFAVGLGNFQLEVNPASPGLNAGTPLPNFTYDIDNTTLARKSGVEVSGNPDMGAHDSALTDPMKFGLPAAQ